MKDYIIAILVVVCLWIWNKKPDEVERKIIKTDTVIIFEKPDTVFIELERVSSDTVWLTKRIFVEPPVEDEEDSINVYMDTVQVDSVVIDFIARTTGELKSVNFGVTTKYQVITNKETKLITKEVLLLPKGIYAGGTFHGNSLSVGLAYVNKRNMVTAEYGLDGSIHVGYKFKLFN